MPEQERLTGAGLKRLAAIEKRIEGASRNLIRARLEWAKVVRELGISAVARELGVTPQAVSERVKAAETAAREAGVDRTPPT